MKKKKRIRKFINKSWRFLKKNYSPIIYIILSVLFIGFIVLMIIKNKMSEIDVSIKYIVFPLYIITSIIFGETARYKIEKNHILLFRRKVDARWATTEEIKESTKIVNCETNDINGGGVPLIIEGDKKETLYVEDSESHTLIIGSTGSGKTRRLIMPLLNILTLNNESMIITDPKGELLEKVGGTMVHSGYKVFVLNFRNPNEGHHWNPLSIPYKLYKEGQIDKATEMINDLAINIFCDESNDNDPFWEQSAVDYFIGLALSLFKNGDEDEINLNSISAMSSQGMEKPEGKLYKGKLYIEEYFQLIDKFSNARISASGTVNAPTDTRASIISVFNQKIRVYTSQENLSQMLSFSEFDINKIGKEKTAVFVIVQDEKKTYHSLATAFIKQCYECLIGFATKNGGELPIRTNFVLDEFANLPAIHDMESIISASRSRKIRLYLVIQSNKHLDETYGEANAEVIKNNCNNLIYLYGRELQTLRDISELCGEREIQLDFNNFEKKPLISTTQLQHLDIGEMVLLQKNNYPYIINIPDISEFPFVSEEYHCIYNQNKTEIKHFDIQNYVNMHKTTWFSSDDTLI